MELQQKPYSSKSSLVMAFESLLKTDGITNIFTGLGQRDRDRKEQYDIVPTGRLSIMSKDALYKDSGVSRNIIDLMVEDCLRDHFIIKHDKSKEFLDLYSKLNLNVWIERTWKTARQMGGAVLLFDIDDGQDSIMPVNPETIKNIKAINVIPKDFLTPLSLDENNNDIPLTFWKKGTIPEWYIVSYDNITGKTYHKSRMMIFEGVYAGENNNFNNHSFPESVLDVNKLAILLYELIVNNLTTLSDSIIQEVLKLSGLQDDLNAGDEDKILKKLITMMISKTTTNRLVIDNEDDFIYQSANLAGYKELVEVVKTFLSMSSKTPITKLFGESPSASIGSQAGGYEEQAWYGEIKNERTKNLLPNILKFISWVKNLLGIKQNELITCDFPALKQLDDKTQAEIEKLKSETKKNIFTMLIDLVEKEIATTEEARKIFLKEFEESLN